jgi:hypothetical protein
VVTALSVDDDAILYSERMAFGPMFPRDGEKPPAGHSFVADEGPISGVAVAVRFALARGAVYDMEGKKLSPADVRKRLRPGDVVVVSTDGERVDPAFLKVFAKDVLLLVPPAPGPGPALPKLPKPG